MPINVAMLVMGAFAAALAVGAAGFGDALIAAAFWLHVMGPSEAVLLIVACGVTICAINQVILRDKLNTSRLVPSLAGGVLGGFAACPVFYRRSGPGFAPSRRPASAAPISPMC